MMPVFDPRVTRAVGRLALWPGAVPGALASARHELVTDDVHDSVQPSRSLRGISEPALTAFHAAAPCGAAMLVIPGGGYTQLVVDKEGFEVARWFNGLGIDAFVLLHRLPGEGHADGAHAPLVDAQRALRSLRALAPAMGVDTTRIGVLGLSSGGHLAAALAANHAAALQPASDTIDALSARPDVLIAGYAPISTNARDSLFDPLQPPLEPPEKQALYDAYPVDRQVTGDFPPAFLVMSDSDRRVPAENFLRLYSSLRRAGVATEMHVFADAPHGFALRSAGPVSAWPGLCAAWLRQRGFVRPPPSEPDVPGAPAGAIS